MIDLRAFKRIYFQAMRSISLIIVVAFVVLTVHASVDHAGLLHTHSDDTAFSTNSHTHSHGVEIEHENHERAPSEHDSDGHRHELQVAKVGAHMSPKLLLPTWDWVRAGIASEAPLVAERGKELGRVPTESPPLFLLTHALLI